jgi:hypothetical protein
MCVHVAVLLTRRLLTRGLLFASFASSGAVFVLACQDQTQPSFVRAPNDPAPTHDTEPEETDEETPDPRDAGKAKTDADARALEAAADAPTSLPKTDGGITGECAKSFGNQLTAGFGRIDGVVYAVQKPSDTQCVWPNDDHVIVQVLMNGAVYRLVVNVQSDQVGQDPKVRYAALAHAMPAPAFAEGWHTGVTLDYATTLGAHNASFSPFTLDELVGKIAAALKPGDPISIYGTSGTNRPESAHLIHRNLGGKDGAIVVSPKSSPKFLLFHFDEQVF